MRTDVRQQETVKGARADVGGGGIPAAKLTTRFPFAASALAIAAVYVVANMLVLWASGTVDLSTLLVLAVVGMALESLAFWLVLRFLAGRERRRRAERPRSYAPLSGPGPGRIPVPLFIWEGRNLLASILIGGVLLGMVGALLIFAFRPIAYEAVRLYDVALAALGVAFFGFVLVGASKRRTFLVDQQGIRIDRDGRAIVAVTWARLSEIGFAKSGAFLWAGDQVVPDAQALFLLRDRDGHLVGRLAPAAMMSRTAAASFVAALVNQARASGIPMRELTYREVASWRRSRTPAGVQHAP